MKKKNTIQLTVTGSWRGTVVSIGCSVMRGICKPENIENRTTSKIASN